MGKTTVITRNKALIGKLLMVSFRDEIDACIITKHRHIKVFDAKDELVEEIEVINTAGYIYNKTNNLLLNSEGDIISHDGVHIANTILQEYE